MDEFNCQDDRMGLKISKCLPQKKNRLVNQSLTRRFFKGML